MALFGSASAAAAVVGVIADTWPVARAPHSGETLRRCGAYNRRTKSTAPVPLKARVRHAFRSTRQSQRMNQLRSQHAMHVEVSLRECRKRKAILQLFSRATCLAVFELDRTSGAISFGFKAGSHLQLHLRIIAHLTDCIVAVCTSSKLFTATEP